MLCNRTWTPWTGALLASLLLATSALDAQVAVRGRTVYTMAGDPIEDGMVIIRDGKVASVGKASDLRVPDGYRVLEAQVVTPGLVDAHSALGLSGFLNYDHDRDQLESSSPVQPELRALDAYNARDELVEWVRSFGVTTVHTGHAPGELISGQTMIVKTRGGSVEDTVVRPAAMVAATLASIAQKSAGKSPGTRGKMVALLRARFVAASEYRDKVQKAAGGLGAPGAEGQKSSTVEAATGDAQEANKPPPAPPRDLALETLKRVLDGELPLLITAHRVRDIANALRLQEEFGFRLVLDGAAESYLLAERIRSARVPVILHPTMARATGDLENMSFETAANLRKAGVDVALQSGYESYVPKARVLLFEAGVAAANGLGFEGALRSITIDAARILGIDDRVGSLVAGKDGDVALYDGDPFEYTTHCVGVVVEGEVVSEVVR